MLRFWCMPGVVLCLVVAAVAQEPETAPVPPDPKMPDLVEVARLIVERTNAFRAEEKLGALEIDPTLAETAGEFAALMAGRDEFSHVIDGKGPADRVAAHEYESCFVAENIAYELNSAGFATGALAEALVEGWKGSPGHRRNMLDAGSTQIGVGVARSVMTGRYYAVQVFARPKSAAIVFEIANRADVAVMYMLGEQEYTIEPRVVRTHTVCRPEDLVFRWPAGEGEEAKATNAIEPEAGMRLVVEREGEEFRVRSEEKSAENGR